MAETKKIVSTAVPVNVEEKLEAAAAECGVKKAEYMRTALILSVNHDDVKDHIYATIERVKKLKEEGIA